MNKNTLIGSILMALIVFGWMYMNKPNEEAMATAKARITATRRIWRRTRRSSICSRRWINTS